jgi:hypothetical protein
LVPLAGWYFWATSAYSVDNSAALELMRDLRIEGVIKQHGCNPNRTVVPDSWWRSAPSVKTQEQLMNVFAAECIAQGWGPSMTVVGATSGAVLARFDGWSIER